MNPNVLVSRFALRGLRRLGVLAGLLTVAACCRPTPCGPISFCGTPGAPKPAQVAPVPTVVAPGVEETTEVPGAKFVRIKIINNTQRFRVNGNTTRYGFNYDTNGAEPYCDAVTLSANRPFTRNVPPNSPLGVTDDPDPDNQYACGSAEAPAFSITLDIAHTTIADVTATIPLECAGSGFVLALVTLNQGANPDDPDGLTATCTCH